MPAFPFRARRLSLATAACAALAACGSINGATHSLVSAITPYKVEVVQGNFVSREQVEALKPGMGRQQVRDILGTPLVTSAFHADRWDYVFTLRRQGVEVQSRKLVVYFANDALARFEGDTMPTEAEFVATLDSKRKGAKAPVLEASEESLQKLPSANRAPAAAESQAPAPDAAVQAAYPPLEPPAR